MSVLQRKRMLSHNVFMSSDDRHDEQRGLARDQDPSTQRTKGNAFSRYLARHRRQLNEAPVRPGFLMVGSLVLAAYKLFEHFRAG